jgi:hypothetical protein
MRHTYLLLMALLLPAFSLSSNPLVAVTTPPGFAVKVLAHGGNACPQLAPAPVLANAATSTTFELSLPPLSTRGGASLKERRATCQLSLDIKPPAGWEYRVKGLSARSSSRLSLGDKATIRWHAWIEGAHVDWINAQITWVGPLSHRDHPVSLLSSREKWVGCARAPHRALTLSLESRLDEASNAGASTHFETPLVVSLDWRPCGK